MFFHFCFIVERVIKQVLKKNETNKLLWNGMETFTRTRSYLKMRSSHNFMKIFGKSKNFIIFLET